MQGRHPTMTAPEVGMTMDYVGICGSYSSTIAPFVTPGFDTLYYGVVSQNGFMLWAKATQFRDCTDGSSNSIMVGEDSGSIAGDDYRKNLSGAWAGVRVLGSSGGDGYGGGGIVTIRYGSNPKTAPPTTGAGYSNGPMTSYHVGGVHALMGDGSVKFLSDNLNLSTLLALCAINDGTVIGEY